MPQHRCPVQTSTPGSNLNPLLDSNPESRRWRGRWCSPFLANFISSLLPLYFHTNWFLFLLDFMHKLKYSSCRCHTGAQTHVHTQTHTRTHSKRTHSHSCGAKRWLSGHLTCYLHLADQPSSQLTLVGTQAGTNTHTHSHTYTQAGTHIPKAHFICLARNCDFSSTAIGAYTQRDECDNE